MGRIRHVKPEFFTHEKLNDLENSHPHLRPMLVFSGLWCQCDANGVFRWRTRSLKREILPWVDYDLEQTLEILIENNLISRFQSNDQEFGMVCKFKEHQHITAKEIRYTNSESKYVIPGKELEENRVNVLDELGDPDNNGTDLKLTGMPTKVEVIKEQMLGEIFIEQACMVNGFDKDKFTEFIQTWIANRILTESCTYPVPRMKIFVIDDYKKYTKSENSGKPTIKKRNSAYVPL